MTADVKRGDEEKDNERQNVADRDAYTQAEFLDENIAQNDTDESRTDVRQAHVEHDRRCRVLAL